MQMKPGEVHLLLGKLQTTVRRKKVACFALKCHIKCKNVKHFFEVFSTCCLSQPLSL